MAYISENEKDKEALYESPGALSNAAVGQAGGTLAGAGGTGGRETPSSSWTNLQAYLRANPPTSKSADLAREKIGGRFESEKQDLTKNADTLSTQARSQVEGNRLAQDQASQMIASAGRQYGQRTDTPKDQIQLQKPSNPADTQGYQDIISDFRNRLGATYQGPTDFTQPISQDVLGYGSGLQGGDDSFNQMMNNFYQSQRGDSRGGGFGVRALQNQLDQNNPYLQQARGDLGSQYSDLNTFYNEFLPQTNEALQGYRNEFKQDQDNLRYYLEGEQSERLGGLQNSVNAQEAIRQEFIAANPYFERQEEETNQFPGFRVTDPYTLQFTPSYEGLTPNLQNVDGADVRNEYNSILDALGLSDFIEQSDTPYSLGDIVFDIDKDFSYDFPAGDPRQDNDDYGSSRILGDSWLRNRGY